MSVMLTTRDTSFWVKLQRGSDTKVVQLNKGYVMIFKRDLMHSGGVNDSPEANIRFFANLPHIKQVPIWINFRNNAKSCVYSTGRKVKNPKRISKAGVKEENLPYVTLTTSPVFGMQKYKNYLCCGKTSAFYKFKADALCSGAQTNEPMDAKDYGDPATFPVRRGCINFADHGGACTWKGAHNRLIIMRKRCEICKQRIKNKKQRCVGVVGVSECRSV